MVRFVAVLSFCALTLTFLNGQEAYEVIQAKKQFKKGRYRLSCLSFSSSIDSDYDFEKTLLMASEACYKCGLYTRSQKFLDQIHATQSQYSDEWYLARGRMAHALGQYEDAIHFYKQYLRAKKKGRGREEAKKGILQAWFAQRENRAEAIAFVQNAGESINTDVDEIHPIASPTVQDRYYFSRADSNATGGLRNKKGHKKGRNKWFRLDILTADLENGQWSSLRPVDVFFNTTQNDYVVDISRDGQVMYVYSGLDLIHGVVKTDTFQNEYAALRKQGDVPSFFGSDFDLWTEDYVIFSSEIDGQGYGGKDLYISNRVNGVWTDPVNMGPRINTRYDEIHPMMTNKGTGLYFSSDREQSMGGFDIYQTTYSQDINQWSAARNLGKEVNSSRDDLGFKLSPDGQLAVFYSDRPGGWGGMDIYVTYLNAPVLEQLATPNPVVYEKKRSSNTSSPSSTTSGKDSLINDAKIWKEQVPDEKDVKEEKFVVRSVELRPVFWKDPQRIVDEDLNRQLSEIERVFRDAPHARLLIMSNTDLTGNRARDYFKAAEIGMTVKEALVEKGIESDRIIVKSYGNGRPLARSSQHSRKPNAWNNRLDWRIIQADGDAPIDVKTILPEVPESLAIDQRQYDDFTGLNYRILLSQSDLMLTNADLLDRANLVIEQRDNSKFRYMLENYGRYTDARAAFNELIMRDLAEPAIIPYLGEHPIPSTLLEKYAEVYPDIHEYLKDQQ